MQSTSEAQPRRYHYDPNYGDQNARYVPVDFKATVEHRPELGASFVAEVEGETFISTIHGLQRVAWRAEPGTACLILGRWSDGTVHLKWPAISGHYMVDGRFPAWVVAEDPSARMAGGGRILSANELPPSRRPFPTNLLMLGLLVLFVLGAAWFLLSQGH